uniref:MADS-box domain-containing protein n=1 Tax=Oryza meridionalis TaxID=40149 RepID=A0A0E0CG30_9ORYZ
MEDVGGVGGEGRRRKRTRGRQRIEMKLIENKDARQVCFSKRREGVFKKASELSVLCGARVAVVFFSPAGRPHCFGHPSVPAVADRFLLGRSPAVAAAAADEEAVVREFNRVEKRLRDALGAAARRRDALDEAARAAGVWDDADVRRAGLADLMSMLAALQRVQAEASERVHDIIVEEAMTHYTATAAANLIDYLDAGPFVSHSPGSHDTTTKLIGGNVVHAPPPSFPPMIMPPPLPPQFTHGFGYTDLAAGYGYNLDHGHGLGHGAAYGTDEFYNATACDFF